MVITRYFAAYMAFFIGSCHGNTDLALHINDACEAGQDLNTTLRAGIYQIASTVNIPAGCSVVLTGYRGTLGDAGLCPPCPSTGSCPPCSVTGAVSLASWGNAYSSVYTILNSTTKIKVQGTLVFRDLVFVQPPLDSVEGAIVVSQGHVIAHRVQFVRIGGARSVS